MVPLNVRVEMAAVGVLLILMLRLVTAPLGIRL